MLIDCWQADYRYNGSYIVQASVENGHPLLFVSINYRLASFGFFSNKALADEGNLNLGFRDQRLALHWVQENIQAFGGDPSKVTIQGESAGGLSINAHLVAFEGDSDGLFSQAISQSGGYFSDFTQPYAAATQTAYNSLLGNSSCASTISSSAEAQLACVRSLPVEIYRNLTASGGSGFSQDGTIFTSKSISAAYASGKYARVPFLVSFTKGSKLG